MSSRQKDVVLGLDFGSTSLRGRLLCPYTDEIYRVQNHHFGSYISRYTTGEFSSIGYPLDTDGDVYLGEDSDPTRQSISLKYGMYVLSNELDELFDEYHLVEVLRKRMHDPAFKARLIKGLKQLFSKVFDRIDEVCSAEQLRVTKIGLSVPSQWKLETESVYRGIISSVVNDTSVEIFFITETEALAHFLCRNHLGRLIRQPNPIGYDIILFLDFGGHNMNSCIYHVSKGDGEGDVPSFYLIGSAVGAGGGSEQWEYNVAQKAIEYIEVHQRRHGAMSEEHKQELRDQFDREKGSHALETSKWFRFERVRGIDGKELEISLGPQTITSCFNDAMKKPLEKVEEQIRELVTITAAKDAWVVVSGGTARHKGIRTRLEQLCTTYGTRAPRFVEALELHEYTAKIAQGTAYAVGYPLTVEQFMDRGAAFGIQTRQGTKYRTSKQWDNTAVLLMSKDHQGTLVSRRVTGLDNLKIICHPGFRPVKKDDELHYSKSYDLVDLGYPSQGTWHFSVTLEGSGDAMSMVMTRWVTPHWKQKMIFFDEKRLPLSFHKGHNCVLVEGTDSSGCLPGVTFEPPESKEVKKAPQSNCKPLSPMRCLITSNQNLDPSTGNACPRKQKRLVDSDDSREFQYMKPQFIASSALDIMSKTRTRKRRRLPDMVYDLDDIEELH